MPLKEAENFSNVFLISLFQINCCCCQFKDTSERTGICSGTLACSAASNAWQLSSQAAYGLLYSYEAREMQLGKSYLWSHRCPSWSFRCPPLMSSLAIWELPRKWEVSEDFPFPCSLWYIRFTLASTDKAVMLRSWGLIGFWFLLPQRHFQIASDMAQALAFTPLSFQRGQGAATHLQNPYTQHTSFPAEIWAWGNDLAELWFSDTRAQTHFFLG